MGPCQGKTLPGGDSGWEALPGGDPAWGHLLCGAGHFSGRYWNEGEACCVVEQMAPMCGLVWQAPVPSCPLGAPAHRPPGLALEQPLPPPAHKGLLRSGSCCPMEGVQGSAAAPLSWPPASEPGEHRGRRADLAQMW